MERLFINLTNGIEVLEKFKNQIPMPIGFIRIQSTYCEQKQWGKILRELDYSFLISIVTGEAVYVADYSAQKKEPRALYQGLEWIKFVLYKRLLGINKVAYVKDYNVTEYFEQQYKKLTKEDLQKIDYVKKFLLVDRFQIFKIAGGTKLDGNYSAYKEILNKYMGGEYK